MSLDKPAARRLDDLEDDVGELKQFRDEFRGAMRFVMAVLGLNVGGVLYLIVSGIARGG